MMGLLRRLRQSHHILFELVVRVLLSVIFVHLEKATPFKRMIHQDEIWLYRNPITADYVPFRYLWVVVVFLPLTVFILHGLLTRNRNEVANAILGFTLALPLNGVLTNSVKLIVGRPRPDFFWRCFPNGEMNSDMECTGLPKLVAEGRKSFPSGHSSFSFVSMGFLSLFLFARLHVFTERARGSSWRLLLSILPLFAALLVALSRTCDYHHHWQDVVVGSMLGMAVATVCYRQYFPPPTTRQKSLRRDLTESDLLHILELASETIKSGRVGIADAAATDEETKLMAPELKTSIKWI